MSLWVKYVPAVFVSCVLIIPCILVLSFEFDFVWSTCYFPVYPVSESCLVLPWCLIKDYLSLCPRLRVPVPPLCVHRDRCDGPATVQRHQCPHHTPATGGEEREIEPIKWMGIIRRPWLIRASGGNLATVFLHLFIIHILKMYCIPASAIIKTHFECLTLRAFLLFLLTSRCGGSSYWSIVLLNTFQHFRSKYVCKLHRSTTLPYGVRECSERVL